MHNSWWCSNQLSPVAISRLPSTADSVTYRILGKLLILSEPQFLSCKARMLVLSWKDLDIFCQIVVGTLNCVTLMYNCVQFPHISLTLYFLTWKICYIDIKSCFKVIICISLNPSKATHFPHLIYLMYFCVWFSFLLSSTTVESEFWNLFYFCWAIQIASI